MEEHMGFSVAKRLVIAAFSLLLSAIPALAHHSLAPYDREVARTIEGVVKDYEFANPHVRLTLLVANPDGSSTEWYFESGSISRLRDRGFNRVSARPGERLTVRYNPKRNGTAGGYFLSFTNESGRAYGPTSSRE